MTDGLLRINAEQRVEDKTQDTGYTGAGGTSARPSSERVVSPFPGRAGCGVVRPNPREKDAASVSPQLDPVIDDAIERLVGEFTGQVPTRTVTAVVHLSRRDLVSCPPAALPELTERQRLMDILSPGGVG